MKLSEALRIVREVAQLAIDSAALVDQATAQKLGTAMYLVSKEQKQLKNLNK